MIKLFNKGKRRIDGTMANGVPFSLHPEKGMAIDTKTGTYLKRLYPNELLDMESVEQQFAAIPDAEESPEAITGSSQDETPPAKNLGGRPKKKSKSEVDSDEEEDELLPTN